MANWSDLKAAVAKVIKTNGNQEITGAVLQNVLNNIISNVGENSTFAGIATPSTNPGAPDGPVFYLATRAGTYANFNGIAIIDGEAVILEWKGSWTKKVTGFATQEQLSKIEKRGREITLADDLKNVNKSLKTDGTLKDTSSWVTYYKVPITKGDSFIADFSLIPTSEGTTVCVIYNSNGAVTETINEKKIDYTFTQDGFISFCFYAYSSNNFYNIYSFRHLNNTIKQIVDGESLYNLDYRKPLSGSYYTATTARSAVPTNIRKFGLIITYKTDATTCVTEQFVS